MQWAPFLTPSIQSMNTALMNLHRFVKLCHQAKLNPGQSDLKGSPPTPVRKAWEVGSLHSGVLFVFYRIIIYRNPKFAAPILCHALFYGYSQFEASLLITPRGIALYKLEPQH